MNKIKTTINRVLRLFSMNRKQRQMMEIIDETVAFYGADPMKRRALFEGGLGCTYINEKIGTMCAIGRKMMDPTRFANYLGTAKNLNNEFGLDILLKVECRGLPVPFWDGLQRLHDMGGHWTATGISNAGIAYVRLLKDAVYNNSIRKKFPEVETSGGTAIKI